MRAFELACIENTCVPDCALMKTILNKPAILALSATLGACTVDIEHATGLSDNARFEVERLQDDFLNSCKATLSDEVGDKGFFDTQLQVISRRRDDYLTEQGCVPMSAWHCNNDKTSDAADLVTFDTRVENRWFYKDCVRPSLSRSRFI